MVPPPLEKLSSVAFPPSAPLDRVTFPPWFVKTRLLFANAIMGRANNSAASKTTRFIEISSKNPVDNQFYSGLGGNGRPPTSMPRHCVLRFLHLWFQM